MASFLSAPVSSFAYPPSIFGETLALTQSEITAYHKIDRNLYSRLVIGLGQDPLISVQVTALWIWLERLGCHPGSLIVRISKLVDWSLHALADEAVACLACLADQNYRPECETRILHLTKAVTGHDSISLRCFHNNRDHIIEGIHKIMDEVCLKAFDDIIRRATRINPFPNPNSDRTSYQTRNPNGGGSGLVFRQNPKSCFYQTPPPLSRVSCTVPYYVKEGGYVDLLYSDPMSKSRRELEAYREFLNKELADVLEHLHLPDLNIYGEASDEEDEDEDEEEEVVVPPDERTIFLTFSKGYPLTEKQVARFFTRLFGDIYESIHMQEKLQDGEQALYARLVLHSDALIPVVIGNKIKAKFHINGKHVWARRYIRRSRHRSSTPTSSSNGSSPPKHPLSYTPRYRN